MFHVYILLTLVSGLLREQFGYNSSESWVLLIFLCNSKEELTKERTWHCSDRPVTFVRYIGVNDISPSQVTWCGQEDGLQWLSLVPLMLLMLFWSQVRKSHLTPQLAVWSKQIVDVRKAEL